ncbi:hypothetical protein OSSY52_06840 [Tepiditoga spiralis]|uniref:Transcriptional coactivator p15 (PC4) C-terminal domain-containing protein n=1 Tax=Tepiditoga spiralis TaxID=2108365 RepID=A0A7G1G6R7_9BACT|nr:PC4/YdbC family ssDNA-binding protein [Tepiditoga spiralis]BBE30543.1 hypothetical protein OSSY52_06840 [Tepiditoga spiralis]
MAELKFEIIETFGTLSESSKGWAKQLKKVSWNEREAKYDIREWSPDESKMSKGITLTKEELIKLKDILNGMDFNE